MSVSKVFGVIRVVILALVTLFSALVLIMGALVTSFSMSDLGGYFVYAAFALAISGLTLISVPVMIALSIARKGAFPSMIVVELSYVCLLWILWLAVGGTIGNISLINYCSALNYAAYQSACMETQAMVAFAFLNWILLMGLNVFLLSLAIVQANRGNSAIWTSCVTGVDYGAPAVSSGTSEAKIGYDNTGVTAQYPQPVPTPQQYQSVPSPQMQYPQPTPSPQQQYPQQYPQQIPSPQMQYPQPIPSPQQYTQPQQVYPPQQVYTPQPQQPGMPMVAQV